MDRIQVNAYHMGYRRLSENPVTITIILHYDTVFSGSEKQRVWLVSANHSVVVIVGGVFLSKVFYV